MSLRVVWEEKKEGEVKVWEADKLTDITNQELARVGLLLLLQKLTCSTDLFSTIFYFKYRCYLRVT